jgi:threonine synthase
MQSKSDAANTGVTAGRYSGLVDKYRHCLPIAADTPAISLCEGNTPLVPLERLARSLGGDVELYAKFEGSNPTGSFKDRGMTVAVTHAAEQGSRAIICASTGNTSASAAAYASRAGMTAFVLIPDGKISIGKLVQARMHGAVVLQIAGNFDDGMRLVREVSESAPVSIVNSINPYRLQGQKTVAFEIIEALGRAPDYHCLPVGNAGNITAHWIGYSECCPANRNLVTEACTYCNGNCPYPTSLNSDSRPVMAAYQASGAAPFLRGAPVAEPDTVATAIRIGNPQSWDGAIAASKESGGWFDELSDAEILAMQQRLAREEGIFCEPASAISVAGACRDIQNGKIAAGSTVVCTVTGHGLKDTDTAQAQTTDPVISVAAEHEAVKKALLDRLS